MPRPRHHLPFVTIGAMLLVLGASLAVFDQGLPGESLGADLARQWVYRSAWNIWSGGYWSLLTGALVHVSPVGGFYGIIHLALDLWGLWYFGRRVEAVFGAQVTFALLFFGALAGSAANLAIGAGPALGSSAMACALLGTIQAGRRRHLLFAEMFVRRDHVRLMTMWLFLVAAGCIIGADGRLNLEPTAPSLFGMDAAALLAGWLVGFFGGHAFAARAPRPSAFLGLAALAALTVASVTWLPWLASWQLWRFTRETRSGHLQTAFAEIQPLLETQTPEPGVLNAVAWTLATSRNDAARDGERAVEMARRACALTAWQSPEIIDTLGAAFAEAGQWHKAEAIEKLAVANAHEQNLPPVATAQLEANLEKIRRREKIRE